VAQSTCAHDGRLFARWWLHNGMLSFGGRKMSKSLGNVLVLHELLEQHPPEALRLLLLRAHDRQPLDWSDSAITQAVVTLDGWYRVLRDLADIVVDTSRLQVPASVEAALSDDLNTPQALAELAEIADDARRNRTPDGKLALLGAGSALGLLQRSPEDWFRRGGDSVVDTNQVEALLTERSEARARRDFARSDAIRDQLKGLGVVLEDGPDGTRWQFDRT
jgi:cysteinyl-tRNA synthetase